MQNDELDHAFENLGRRIASDISKANKKNPPAVMPATILSVEEEKLQPFVYYFNAALNHIAWVMNYRMKSNRVSLQKETALMWTLMGSRYGEYLVFTLDPSFTFFEIACLLPVPLAVKWFFSGSSPATDIQVAIQALYSS
jgi:hypothetical protein